MEEMLSIDREYIRVSWAVRVIAETHLDGRLSVGVAHEMEVAYDLGKDICRTRDEAWDSYKRWQDSRM
jgi:hypothetical protein